MGTLDQVENSFIVCIYQALSLKGALTVAAHQPLESIAPGFYFGCRNVPENSKIKKLELLYWAFL